MHFEHLSEVVGICIKAPNGCHGSGLEICFMSLTFVAARGKLMGYERLNKDKKASYFIRHIYGVIPISNHDLIIAIIKTIAM